ncbi:YhdH/YhfP family quinone oxidoreductase [Thiocystis violascens]|uniref:Putative quinone oxidoreductase, YhdH/YhfP family n=1 Tax=Thiocystis violascens (strain ATCC 17096 / DSM 198 / 6111) TaxID=765911 RepID=I3Y5L6_THIV6|nr:YhdH/YhfP family quinone oxidoreductase [Thiocystis violascens]AFL72284.1 putative quinone oxidoreductase, YhdH/YhfP family [Thiocystis violascens DSM 198]
MKRYSAFRIHRDDRGHHAGIETLTQPEPAAGEVLIRVSHSSVNYKDALAGTGQGKILRTFPLVGGIDAAGRVERSNHPDFQPGDAVIATGWGMSFDHDGGYAEILCVPGDWLLPLPDGLDAASAMILGTAGFTAALAAHRMLTNGQRPELGPILITGASGGVGSMAIALFARLGYEVVAISGKPALHGWLRGLGANRVLDREALAEAKRPLEKAQWGGAIDTVGGDLLAQITRTMAPGGNIAAIGLAGGHELHASVMPFILRGVSLLGCNSVDIPSPLRAELWRHLASDWRPARLETMVTETIDLEGLSEVFARMLAGRTHGRILVRME